MPTWSQCAYGCCYWKMDQMNKLVKPDMNRMEFSAIALPPDHDRRSIATVEEGEGRRGMFSVTYEGTSVFYYTIMTKEWRMESMIPLPFQYDCYIQGASEGYILLVGIRKDQNLHATCFSLGIKTSKIEEVLRVRYP
uniref:F-box associated domain-containing protein n=1 Tax=Arundo donax TaxID=35708 RepID=A0A0A9F781_ARUDO